MSCHVSHCGINLAIGGGAVQARIPKRKELLNGLHGLIPQ
jgi:hypothetical protein